MTGFYNCKVTKIWGSKPCPAGPERRKNGLNNRRALKKCQFLCIISNLFQKTLAFEKLIHRFAAAF